MLRPLLAALFLVLFFSLPADADDLWKTNPALFQKLQDATGAYIKKDYQGALQIWQPLAEAGNQYAQYSLGRMCELGQGVNQDNAKAVEWYQKAADQGNRDAEVALGVAYRDGRGVAQDYLSAAKWLRKAADENSTDARYMLSDLYERGLGVKQDYVESSFWRSIAATGSCIDDCGSFVDYELDKQLTAEQVAEVKCRVDEWKAHYYGRPAPVCK